jgi:hypothetical protein
MSATDTFFSLWADIEAIGSAAGVLGWDQETYMPPKGQPRRGQVLATLAGLEHDKLTSPELEDALAAAEADAAGDPILAAQTREARRTVTRAKAIPLTSPVASPRPTAERWPPGSRRARTTTSRPSKTTSPPTSRSSRSRPPTSSRPASPTTPTTPCSTGSSRAPRAPSWRRCCARSATSCRRS